MSKSINAVNQCLWRLERLKEFLESEEAIAKLNGKTKELIELGIKKQGVVMSIKKINTYKVELKEIEVRLAKQEAKCIKTL